MILFRVLLVLFLVLVTYSSVLAGNFGVGAHIGYGVFKHKEIDKGQEARSTQDVILFGVSGEYSFVKPDKFFVGITTDWTIGLEDKEEWTVNDTQVLTNDIKITGQFYDLRFGYKNSFDRFYYRFYVSGGWDGLYFKRKNFTRGNANVPSGRNTRDYSLWRTGLGTGFGYRLGRWALDARAAYSYNPIVDVDDSALSQFTFDTSGTCLDMGFGIARRITDTLGFYAGGSYTLIKLDKSDVINGFFIPETETRLLAGVINLTYAF